MKRKPIVKHPITLAAAPVAAILLLGGCSQPHTVSATSTAPKAATVAVVPVTRKDMARSLELAAEFRPYEEIDLHAKVAGYLKSISVDVGDQVRQGQLIAVLEVPEMVPEEQHASASLRRSKVEVERARADLARAEADVKLRRISYDRLAGVAKARPNLIAQQEVDTMAARLSEAEAQLAAAKATVAAAEEQVSVSTATRSRVEMLSQYLRITAPFSGVITKRMADPGEMIQAGTASHVQAQPVVRLSSIDRLRLVLPVPESIAPRVRIGGPVEVRVDSLKRVIQGRISRFTQKLDSATRTMETEVDIANQNHEIRPGMFGYARLLLDRRQDALGIPVQALSNDRAKPTVLVVAGDGKVEERRIETGLETPETVEVMSGLNEEELVIVGNRGNVRPGQMVTARRVEAAKEQ
jgi:RND family efflux transporter MFP subunit